MDLRTLIEKEAAKQIAAIEAMETRFNGEAIRLQTELYELLVDKFIESLAVDSNGKLIYNTKNITRVNDLNKTWEAFQEKSYRPALIDFAKDLVSIVDVEAGYFLAVGKQFDIAMEFGKITDLISKQIGIDLATEAITEGSYLWRLLEGSQVRDAVADYVLQNVSAKVSFQELRKGLETLVKGDETTNGEMQRYLRTYAYDTFSHIQRSIDLNIADTYGLNSFVYFGDVIKDTREFCLQRVNQVFTREDLESWQGEEWAGKNDDVPVEISLGGYNCRHKLNWIPDEAAEFLSENIKEEVVKEESDVIPENKQDLVNYANKKYKWDYKIDGKGRIYQNFMGSKMYITPDKLTSNINRIETYKVIKFNSNKITDYLEKNGYELHATSGTSRYYHRNDVGTIRVSDHENLSELHNAPSINAFSDKKDGWKSMIDEIKELENYAKK